MGLILDSSVLISAERNGQTVAAFLKQVLATTSDQEVALSSVALVELVHGIYRANTPQIRSQRVRAFQHQVAAPGYLILGVQQDAPFDGHEILHLKRRHRFGFLRCVELGFLISGSTICGPRTPRGSALVAWLMNG